MIVIIGPPAVARTNYCTFHPSLDISKDNIRYRRALYFNSLDPTVRNSESYDVKKAVKTMFL